MRTLNWVWIGLWTWALIGCTNGTPTTASADVIAALSQPAGDFALATAPMPFSFPRDHGAHPDYRTEWWYFTGNLQDESGAHYGYQLTFFRSGLTATMAERSSDLATNQLYMAHFALTSAPADDHVSFERFSRGAGELAGALGEPTFAVWLDDWRVEQIGDGTYRLEAQIDEGAGQFGLALTLTMTQPPVLHGDQGLSQKGPEFGNANHYYSLVGLKSAGELTFAGKTQSVTGSSWMDHEFGTSALSGAAVGWDWFSIQLDDGSSLMMAQVRNRDGSVTVDFEGTLVDADGNQTRIAADEFLLTPLRQWTSPRTGFTYPAGWRAEMPAHGLDLTIEPLMADQEMAVSFVYWEGAVTVTGNKAGGAVTGLGYVELTGYNNGAGGYQR